MREKKAEKKISVTYDTASSSLTYAYLESQNKRRKSERYKTFQDPRKSTNLSKNKNKENHSVSQGPIRGEKPLNVKGI